MFWIVLLPLHVLCIFVTSVYTTPPIFERYEGDFCRMEDGSEGICKKLTNCPSRVKEVEAGKRDADSAGRCGFEGPTEIVCCPHATKEIPPSHSSVVACREYNKKHNTFFAIHGLPAHAVEYPYVAAIGYKRSDQSPIEYTCSGCLVSYEHVLTAAHCIRNAANNIPVEVRLGNENIKSNASNVQRIEIGEIIVHPRFKRSRYYHDIAILKLKTRAKFSRTAKPVCLETKPLSTSDTSAKRSLILIGWGATSFTGDASDILIRTPKLSFVENEECNKWYSDFGRLPNGVNENLICAMDENKTRGSDACHGDSGGPLIISNNLDHKLIGISAFGQACGGVVPGVYTAVFSYINWIGEQVWKGHV